MNLGLFGDALRRIAKLVKKHPKEAVTMLNMLAAWVDHVDGTGK